MSSHIIVLSAIVSLIVQIQVRGELVSTSDDVTYIQSSNTAFQAVDNLKKTFQRMDDYGLNYLDKVRFECKINGEIMKKKMLDNIEEQKGYMLIYFQATVKRTHNESIDVATECDANITNKLDGILTTFNNEASSKLKLHEANCADQSVSIDNVARMKKDGVKLEEEVQKCTNKTCFENVTKTSQRLNSSAGSRLKSISAQALNESTAKEADLMSSLVQSFFHANGLMLKLRESVLECIDVRGH